MGRTQPVAGVTGQLARLLRLQQRLARPTTPDAAFELMLTGRWTWDDVHLAARDDLDLVAQDILAGAAEARRRREAGHGPHLGTPICVASEIVSYLPDETPPAEYREYIERDMLGLHNGPRVLTKPRFIHAVYAMAVMRTPDAMALRRQYWG